MFRGTITLSLLISNGLLFGAILSLLLVALMLGSLAAAPLALFRFALAA